VADPTTRAGKDYLAGTLIGKDGVGRAIAAIEAEARQQEREALAERIEGHQKAVYTGLYAMGFQDAIAAVLSILRGEKP
jgi:hypothetical protein